MSLPVEHTSLDGVLLVKPRIYRDARGFFLESYQKRAYAEAGLDVEFVQDNHSRSQARVVRGLHYQDMSAPLGKLIRCTLGAVFDVAVDLRVGSPTFARWLGVELTEENGHQIWIPPGFAHGFAALTEWADIQYKCTGYYTPAAEGAVAWNDPEIGIAWPVAEPLVSDRDARGLSLRDYLQRPAFIYAASQSQAGG
jgi:dTDP-4-dehydrorhamnose 3,5-epimerase